MSAPVFRRVLDIRNKEFFAALRVPRGRAGTENLRRAIALGASGRAPQAYRALGRYHSDCLAGEWERSRAGSENAALPGKKELNALYRNTINVWHSLVIEFGSRIDWNTRHLGKNIPGFHYYSWFAPAVHHFVQTGNAAAKSWLEKTIVHYEASLPTMIDALSGPRLSNGAVMGPLCCRGKMGILPTAYLALLEAATSSKVIGALTRHFLGMGRAMKIQMDHEARHGERAYNNISIAGTHALFLIAKLFPEFKESAGWSKRAIERFGFFARNSFFSDGGYGERVWGYGMGALSYLSGSYIMAQRHGGLGDQDKVLRDCLRKAFRWYAKTMGPGGREPCFGDGACSPKKTPRAFDMAQKVFPGEGPYLGVDRTKSYLLKPSGFAIMRNGDDDDSAYLNISFGKYACWHDHWEQLSMNLWAYDTPIIEELDRWGPYHNPLDILVRAPEAHNQFLVDGMVMDPRYTDGTDVGWYTDDRVDCFTAVHRAYRFEVFAFKGHGTFNMNGVVRRTVVFVKDAGYALVMDSVYDENHAGFNRAVSQYWHSPFEFTAVGPGVIRTRGRVGCVLAFARTDGLRRLECTADFVGDEVEHGNDTPNRYTLRARRWGKVEEPGRPGFATLLQPFKGSMPTAGIRPLPTENGEPYRTEGYEVTTPLGRDLILLNPEKESGIVCQGREVTGRGLVILGRKRGEIRWQ